MGSYVEGALTKGEQVVHQGKVSIWSLVPLLLLGLIFLAFYRGWPSVLDCRPQSDISQPSLQSPTSELSQSLA